MFRCGASFSCVFDEMFIEVLKYPSSTTPLPPCLDKFMAANVHPKIILFAKRSILNVWQCSEYVSVSITAQ